MERKEELQDQCQSLKRLLEKESGTAAGLKEELNEANRKTKVIYSGVLTNVRQL